jgi:hypothetical protein
MILRFRYKLVPTKRPILPLGGRMVRPRPFLAVSLIGPAGTIVETAHLDSAADDCVFPSSLAVKIGVDLVNAPEGEAAGVGKTPVALRYAQVKMRLVSGQEWCEWPAWVAFTDAPLNRPLLGFAGFLQFFTATFHGDREAVELAVNGLYPGITL